MTTWEGGFSGPVSWETTAGNQKKCSLALQSPGVSQIGISQGGNSLSMGIEGLDIKYQTSEAKTVAWAEGGYVNLNELSANSYNKDRLKWSIVSFSGDGTASIDSQTGELYFGENGFGSYRVRVESLDLASCYDTKTVNVLSVDLNAAYSDQISGRECNALPGQNPMYMGARADNRGYLQIDATDLPQQINNIGMVGVRHGTSILADELIQTPKTPIDFAPAGGRELYEVVAGCDLNTDGTLQNSEVTEVMTDQLMLLTQGDYNYSDGLLTFFAIGTIGVGSQLLEAFIDDTIPPNVVNSATTIASTELTHPIGANWDASCSASTRLYTYVEGTDVSDDVEEDSHTITALQTSLGQHQSEVQDYFTQNPTVNEHTFGPWNWQANGLEFDGLALQFAFGHVNIAGTVSVTVRRSDLAVTHISYTGSFTDVYDFNYVGAYPSVHGATMQAGFPTLGNGGRVFRDRVEFSRDTTSFSYDFN